MSSVAASLARRSAISFPWIATKEAKTQKCDTEKCAPKKLSDVKVKQQYF